MLRWFKERLNTPIEHRDYGKMYAILAGLLFLFTLGALVNEISSRRPWKEYQKEYRELRVKALKKQLSEAKKGVEKEAIKARVAKLEQLDAKLATPELKEAQNNADKLTRQIIDMSKKRADVKAYWDSKNYYYEHSLGTAQPEKAKEYKQELKELEAKMAEYDKNLEGLEKQRTDAKAVFKATLDQKNAIEKEADSIFKKVADLKTKIDETEAMPIKIKQVMIGDMDKSNFGNYKMRVDRCQTCHLGIGDPVFANEDVFGKLISDEKKANHAKKVFGPHPKLEILKLHPIEKFGCTSCHGGQPMAIDDVEHAHGLQKHWERPLLTGGFVEGSCRNCHQGGYNFVNAKMAGSGETTNWIAKGRKLFIDFGCFGCHEANNIPDWKEYKTGPSLLDMSKKLTPEWTYNWIMNPQKWNEHTRMPNFRFTKEQTESVVAYLFDAAKNSTYTSVSGSVGDATKGKQTVFTVGCIACHTIDTIKHVGNFEYKPNKNFVDKVAKTDILWENDGVGGNRMGEGNAFGPDLSKVGSKVTADWLYDWVKNPKHYNPNSRMPRLRLSDQEAADVTAYLMSQKDPHPQPNPTLGNLTNQELIKKGEGVIREYGCYGCHNIKGFENEGKVSVTLADYGSKTGHDLFFGFIQEPQLHGVRKHFKEQGHELMEAYEEIPNGQDWWTWTVMKMKNSRIFQTDAIPQKMPVFNMTDEEAYALAVLLKSFSKAFVPPEFRKGLGEYENYTNEGRFLTHWYNCMACHKVENQGSYIRDYLGQQVNKSGDEAAPYAPPNLNTVGAKIQENWLYSFLKNPDATPVRSWLSIRMPSYDFSEEKLSKLSRYFLGLESKPLNYADYSSYPTSDSSLAAGQKLFTKLNCQQCHAVGGTPANGGATAVPVPNLAMAGNRLKPEWIERWLRNPSGIVPGSKMPAFWGTDEEPVVVDSTILGGNRNQQIAAVRDYVWRLGGAKGMGMPGTPDATRSVATSAGARVAAPVTGAKDTTVKAAEATKTTEAPKDTTKKTALLLNKNIQNRAKTVANTKSNSANKKVAQTISTKKVLAAN